VRGVNNDGNVRVVLGRCSNHRWATDVDLLDGLIALCSGSNGLNKWVPKAPSTTPVKPIIVAALKKSLCT
jgi:hypothetical protein